MSLFIISHVILSVITFLIFLRETVGEWKGSFDKTFAYVFISLGAGMFWPVTITAYTLHKVWGVK